jgi:hypothetical protein
MKVLGSLPPRFPQMLWPKLGDFLSKMTRVNRYQYSGQAGIARESLNNQRWRCARSKKRIPLSHLCKRGGLLEEDKCMRRSSSENCARIRDLGYRPFTRITMYGQRVQIVSDPFIIGTDVVVHVTSEKDPQIRILRLPASILVGLRELLPEKLLSR